MIDRLVSNGVFAVGIEVYPGLPGEPGYLMVKLLVTNRLESDTAHLVNPDKPGESYYVSGLPRNSTNSDIKLTLLQ